jgi:hypothetical protein
MLFHETMRAMGTKDNPSTDFSRHVIQSILVSKEHPQVLREGVAGARKVAARHADLSGGEAENTPGFYIFTQIDSTLMDPRSFVTRREGSHVLVRVAKLASDSAAIDMERTASRCDMGPEGARKPRLPCTVVYEDPELSAVVRMTDAQYSRAPKHANARSLLRRYGKARIRFLSLPLAPVLKRVLRGSAADAPHDNPSKAPHRTYPRYPKVGSEVIFVPRQGSHPEVREGEWGMVIAPIHAGPSPFVNVAWSDHGIHQVLASDLLPVGVKHRETEHLPVGTRVAILREGRVGTVVRYWMGRGWDPGAAGLVPVERDDGSQGLLRHEDLERISIHNNPSCGSCPTPGDVVSLQPSHESAQMAMDQCAHEGCEMPRFGSVCIVGSFDEHTGEVLIRWDDGLEQIWAVEDVCPIG